MSGLTIDFEKDELSEFIRNNYKMIDITALVSIKVNGKTIGTIFNSSPS